MRQLKFHEIRGDGRQVDPENEIFRKIPKKCQIFKEYSFKIDETETGMK